MPKIERKRWIFQGGGVSEKKWKLLEITGVHDTNRQKIQGVNLEKDWYPKYWGYKSFLGKPIIKVADGSTTGEKLYLIYQQYFVIFIVDILIYVVQLEATKSLWKISIFFLWKCLVLFSIIFIDLLRQNVVLLKTSDLLI